MIKIIQRIRRAIEAIYRIVVNPKNLYYVLENENQYEKKVKRAFGITELGCEVIELIDLEITFPQNLSLYSFLGGTVAPTDLILLRGLAQRFKKNVATSRLEPGEEKVL